MARTRTGWDVAILGARGAARAAHLLRIGSRAHADQGNEGSPVVVNILRFVQSGGSSASMQAPNMNPVAGLEGIQAALYMEPPWMKEKSEGDVPRREGERWVKLIDVPDVTPGGADQVLLSDRLQFDDSQYGPASEFKVVEIRPYVTAGWITVKCVYDRKD